MFENGVEDVAEVCGYQSNDAGHIEVYCIEPSSGGPDGTPYDMKHATGVEGDVIENCLADAASLMKNAYCMESRTGEQMQMLVTDRQYQMPTGADSTNSVYRLETSQTYQIDSSNIDINQANHEVNSDSPTGSLVLQCVEYVDNGGRKCDSDDPLADTFQAAAMASTVTEGSYEIVMLPNGSRALRKIKPAPDVDSRVNMKEIQVVEATDASDISLSVGTPVMSTSVVADADQTGASQATVVMAAETPTHGGSSYIILPSSIVSKPGLEGSPPTVIYQLAEGAIIQGKCPVCAIQASGCQLCYLAPHSCAKYCGEHVCITMSVWPRAYLTDLMTKLYEIFYRPTCYLRPTAQTSSDDSVMLYVILPPKERKLSTQSR